MATYAITDADGFVLGVVEGTLNEAVRAASAPYGHSVIVDGTASAGEERYAANPDGLIQIGSPSSMARKAFSATGLPKLGIDHVMQMPLDHAHATLLPFFNLKRGGSRVRRYDTPQDMARHLLGQNYKTEKTDKVYGDTEVQGLSLVPAREASKYLHASATLCLGSNDQCRSACLVFSGNNRSDPYNARAKMARTKALIMEPWAFCRMLVESISRHSARILNRGGRPFFRLNVYSDIPWELVIPGLFEMFPGVMFYDYTKLSGRTPPPNYDLTFSFSGTNESLARYELSRGTRVAVVFAIPARGMQEQHRQRRTPLPETLNFAGATLPVVDGDKVDLRPLDPSGVIVGLRWKPTKVKSTEMTRFVVRCTRVSRYLTVALTPGQEPADVTTADDTA